MESQVQRLAAGHEVDMCVMHFTRRGRRRRRMSQQQSHLRGCAAPVFVSTMQRAENDNTARKNRHPEFYKKSRRLVARCSAWTVYVIKCGSALPQRCEQRSRLKWHICMQKLRRPGAPAARMTLCHSVSTVQPCPTLPRRHRHSTPNHTTVETPHT